MPDDTRVPYDVDELFAVGEQKSYTDEALKEIAFPLGGIGTGTVSLGGRGQLRDWEIFNRPGKGKGLMYTFPAVFTRTASGKKMARVLESKIPPPHIVGGGCPPHEVYGLPRLSNAIFKGEYPFAYIDFRDAKLPVKIDLTAFNPMIPLNEQDSAIPAAVLRYKVTNTGDEPVDATVCWSLQNACGNDGTMSPTRHNSNYGQQKNDYIDDGEFRGVKLTQSKYPENDPKSGSMAIVTTHKKVTYQEAWTRGGWWDDAQAFWDDFRTDGEFTDNGVHDRSDDITSDITSLGLKVSLKPGESAELPFIITWYFPNRVNYWNREEEVKDKPLRNRYADLWKDAWDVAGYVVKNLERLESESAAFRDALYSSTLPRVALDAAGANMSIMRTCTGLYLDDDRFYGFEGCSDNSGCCPMNCTHVYNYEQALAFLYPKLERSMRLTDYTNQLFEDGKMAFRTLLPRQGKPIWGFHGAADGQMGCILKLYREWLMSGDEAFLREVYPGAKKSLEYAWVEWDKDQDGVMEGIQHNTYDIEFLGPNTMMGTLYMGALKAMEKLAAVMGDDEFAAKCKDIFEKGSYRMAESLWNGEFFIQDVDVETAPRYQYGKGCLSDQLLGQWFCEVVGLGKVLPQDKVKTTLESIFNYNWKPDLSDHESVQRTYALNDEAGLLLCSWPNGGRPRFPFTYADEVWTGIEYQVASHLIYEDMLEEGLAIVKGVRDRHDGIARNPWDEFECGHHYARAMASWSLVTALSGFLYNAPKKKIAFGPKVSASDFRCFYSTGSAWGTFTQELKDRRLIARIGVTQGELELENVKLDLPSDIEGTKGSASIDGSQSVEVSCARKGESVMVTLSKPAKIKKGQVLEIVVA
jgi:non-lysosomal glucosylceramidase